MSTKKTKKATKQSKKVVKKSAFKREMPKKVQYVSARDLANEMGLSTRDHNPTDGTEPNPSLMVVRAPGPSSDVGRETLMKFIKRTGLTVVRKGKESIRYLRGSHYWLVQVKKAEFEKAKAVLVPPPTPKVVEMDEYNNEDGPDECESCGDECAPRDYSAPPTPKHATPSGSYNDGVEACAKYFESERNQGLADALRRNCKR